MIAEDPVSHVGTVRRVVWRDIFPWLLLLRSWRLSFRFSIWTSAFAGYLLMLLGSWLIGGFLFGGTEDPAIRRWHAQLLEAVGTDPDESPLLLSDPRGFAERAASAPAVAWWQLTGPFLGLFEPGLSASGLSYLLLRNAWNVLVWALAGGTIARVAAFAYSKDQRHSLTAGFAEALVQFPAHALAPLLAGAAILVVSLPLLLGGVLGRIDWLAWAAGMLWLIVLGVGVLLAVLVIGLAVGWPLMWAAVAVERSDPFDAVSRTYAYVYQRPLRLVAYVALIAALAMLGALAANLLVDATVGLADWAFGWGSGSEPLAPAGATAQPGGETALAGAAAGRRFWIRAAAAWAAAYPIGFLWAAAVGVYLLLRLHVDSAQTDEIAEDEQEAMAGLPPLTPHELGVPGVNSKGPRAIE